MLSQVIAKNVGDVFFETQCTLCLFTTTLTVDISCIHLFSIYITVQHVSAYIAVQHVSAYITV